MKSNYTGFLFELIFEIIGKLWRYNMLEASDYWENCLLIRDMTFSGGREFTAIHIYMHNKCVCIYRERERLYVCVYIYVEIYLYHSFSNSVFRLHSFLVSKHLSYKLKIPLDSIKINIYSEKWLYKNVNLLLGRSISIVTFESYLTLVTKIFYTQLPSFSYSSRETTKRKIE